MPSGLGRDCDAGNTAAVAGVIGDMHPSKLRTAVAILATMAGFSALAATAQAQISGSTGGNVIATHRAPGLSDPILWLTDGNALLRRSW